MNRSGHTDSGLYYLRARYYDPTTAQFLSRDPMVATTRSPYAYVGGNPLNATDPSGECGLWGNDTCLGDAAGAAGNVIHGAVSAVCDGATDVGSCASNNYNDFLRGNSYVRQNAGLASGAFCFIPGTQLACLASDAGLAATGEGER